jgi:hypothetical protein
MWLSPRLRKSFRQPFASRRGQGFKTKPRRDQSPLLLERLEGRDLPSISAVGIPRPTFILHNAQPEAAPSGLGFTPDQLRTAYGINSISFQNSTVTGDGTGQTIAITDYYNQPNIVGDVNAFDQNVYLSAADKSSGTTLFTRFGGASSFLTVYDQNGNVINPSATTVPNAPKGGWGVEISLDVEWAHSIAPAAKIDLVECATSLFTGTVTAAGLPGVSAVSMSWSGAEASGESSLDGDFIHAGVTFLAATGDNGAPGGYPAYSPNVVAVGGTSLTLNADNTWAAETGWSGSGGGTSLYESEPAYQAGVQTTGFRTIPDVSMDADPNTGVVVYDSYDFGAGSPWVGVGGTSLATPCWAGLVAITNQGRALAGTALLNASSPTQALTLLYNLPSTDFHDNLGGSNGSSNAGITNPALYNTITGLGSPITNTLVPDLAAAGVITISPSTLPGGQVGVAYSQTITASQGVGDTTLTVTTLPPGLTSSPSPDQLVISGMPTTGGTYSFTVQATDTAGHSSSQNYTLKISTSVSGPLVVTSTSPLSSVTGSLPWAVAQADGDGNGQAVLIEFASGAGQPFASAQTITLQGTLALNNTTTGESITILGPAAGLTIQGGGSGSNFAVFSVAAGTTATLQGLTISNGFVSSSGGGINNAGTLTLNSDLVTGNSAIVFGGGIYSATGSTLTVTNTTVSHNNATATASQQGYGAGVFDWGTMTLSDDTFNNNTAGNVGGGVYNAGVTTVNNCTFVANTAVFGGGIGNQSSLTVQFSTISRNTAVSGGKGGGIANISNQTLQDSIVSGNTSSINPDVYGAITTDKGHNLFGTALRNKTFGTGDLFSNAPGLGNLANNGGPTQTVALQSGSPAIGKGATIAGITTDQRGQSRAATPDMGAYEFNVPAPAVTSVSPATGPAAGGTQVTISGTSLGSAAIVAVDFGPNNPATIVSDTGGTLVVIDPAGTGAVDITVTTAGGTSATSPLDVFTYTGSTNGTTTSVQSSQNPSVFGQSVSFTATVSPTSGSNTPSGTVTFMDGNNAVDTETLSGGTATYTTSALAVGSHSITVVYNGDANDSGSTSQALSETVNQAGTTTVLADTVTTVFGQNVTFTATVSVNSPGMGTPGSGTVTFFDGGSQIGTGSVSGGVATYSTSSLSVGSHTITASYGGDDVDFLASPTSGSVTQTVNQAATTTALAATVSSVFGQSVTFTATVSVDSPGAGTPDSGTVTFFDSGSEIGTGSVSGGAATYSTSSLSVGSHTITASYGGDGVDFLASPTSDSVTQTVNQAGTTTALAATVTTVFGQSVTFTATVSVNSPGAGTPGSGTVTFFDGGLQIGTGSVSGGVATYSTSSLAVGSHTITASYGGDGVDFLDSPTSGSVTQTVNQAGTTTALAATVTTVFGQSVMFTATVSVNSPGAGTPGSGTVTFFDAGKQIGTGTVSGGVATYLTSSLAVGSHTITASYGGDGVDFLASPASPAVTQVVGKDSSTTAIGSSANPSVNGQTVTITATVTANSPGSGIPSGTVTFKVNGTAQPATKLNAAGQAFFTFSPTVGTYNVTATYNGGPNFTFSNSSNLSQVVKKDGTTTALASSANPSVNGQTVTFTATVTANSPGSGTPQGTVTFKVNGTAQPVAQLNAAGQATFTFSPTVGSYTITASYNGGANFTISTSPALHQVVNKDAATVMLVSSLNPSTSGQAVTFTATVSAAAPGSGTPTGSVEFLDGTTVLGFRTLSAGQATFKTSTLSVGSHAITAKYEGDSLFNVQTSAVLNQTVNSAAVLEALLADLVLSPLDKKHVDAVFGS